MAVYEYKGHTSQFGSPHQNLVIAIKVDPNDSPVFSKLAETVADVNGDFAIQWNDWNGRVLIGIVDDDGGVQSNCRFLDWNTGIIINFDWFIHEPVLDSSFSHGIDGLAGIDFKPDGTELYMADSQSPYTVRQFTLSTPWDISTATLTHTLTLTSGFGLQPSDIQLKPDGTELFWSNNFADRLHKMTLSTPWDLSTAVDAGSVSLSFTGFDEYGFEISPDGTKGITHHAGTGTITSITMSTPWDINTISGGASYNPSLGGSLGSLGVTVHPSGEQVYITSTNTNKVHRYDLSTPWDVSTAVNVSISGHLAADTRGLYIMENGQSLFTNLVYSNVLRKYNLPSVGSITGVQYTNKSADLVALGGSNTNPRDTYMSPDGTKFFVSDIGPRSIYSFDLSTPYDISTAGNRQSLSYSGQVQDQGGFTFNSDGTSIYIAGYTPWFTNIVQYNLSTPYDLTTASFHGKTQVHNTSFQREISGMVMSPDGSTILTAEDESAIFRTITLSTPGDILTASYSGPTASFFNTGSSQEPKGLAISSSGTSFMVLRYVNSSQALIDEYTMAVPYNLGTAAHRAVIGNVVTEIGSGSSSPAGISLINGDTGLIIGSNDNDAIYQYDIVR